MLFDFLLWSVVPLLQIVPKNDNIHYSQLMPTLKFHCSLEFNLRSSQRGDFGRIARAPFHWTAAGNRTHLVLRYRVLEFVTRILTNASLRGNANSRREIDNQITMNWVARRDIFLILVFASFAIFEIIAEIKRMKSDNLLYIFFLSLYNMDGKPSPPLAKWWWRLTIHRTSREGWEGKNSKGKIDNITHCKNWDLIY